VVALDGACELAVRLAAHERGVRPPARGGLPALLDELRNALGDDWEQHGAQGFSELHRARNAVQHDGVLPDGGHLPLWTGEVERFVRSLIAAAFGAELATVSAASAVDDAKLRAPLLRAEQQLRRRRSRGVVARQLRGARGALSAFRSRRGLDAFRFRSLLFHKWQEFRDIKGTVDGIQELLDVATLASDPGEWLWFRTAVSHADGGRLAPSSDDARRALAFALTWILRYESFAARYVKEPEHPPHVSASPFERYDSPRVLAIDASAEAAWSPEHVRFEIQLSDVPPELDLSVYDVARGRGETGMRLVSQRVRYPDHRLEVELPDRSTPTEVVRAVHELVAASHVNFEARMARRREIEEAAAAVAERYRRELAAHDTQGRVRAVSAELDRDGRHRLRVELALPEDLAPYELGAAITAELPADRRTRQVGVWEGAILFDEGLIPPAELPDRVDAGLATVRAREAERARSAPRAGRRSCGACGSWPSVTVARRADAPRRGGDRDGGRVPFRVPQPPQTQPQSQAAAES
jgi:hypothetical protein